MLPIENDFSQFDRLDWLSKIEVDIRFLVELLGHLYSKTPDQIIEVLCQSAQELPLLRYEERQSDDSSDPQWLLLRFFTVLHIKDLLSRTLESSSWGLIQSNSLSCREEVKYKTATYPSVPREEIIYQSESGTNDVAEITRIIKAPYFVPLDQCWAYRSEVEQYLSTSRAFEDWFDLLPSPDKEIEAKPPTPTKQIAKRARGPQWEFRRLKLDFWSIGPIENPKALKSIGGFSVIHSGLTCPNLELSPFGIDEFPRLYNVADDVPRTGIPETRQSYLNADLSKIVDEANGLNYMENMAGQPVLDGVALRDYKNEITKLKEQLSKIESVLVSNTDDDDRERLEIEKKRIEDLLEYLTGELRRNTRPDRRSKTDDKGDAEIRETKRLRESVRRAIKKLRDNDLNDVAEHLTDHFHVKERLVIYDPIPGDVPKWSLILADSAGQKSEN